MSGPRAVWRRRGIDAGGPTEDDHWVDYESWPANSLALSALVALVVNDIELRDDRDREVLLQCFIQTAWPSGRAARQ